MRVVSGSARGRKLKAPKSTGITRPMADKIKEALFSVLASLGVEADRVLDLYAGSGAVGIEALSRGAIWCDFVDRDHHAVQAIRENLDHVGFSDRARVHHSAVLPMLRGALEPYDLVIFDPPYADSELLSTLEALSSSPAVMDGTVVAVGHSPRVEMPERVGRLVKLRGRCHGDSCFAVYDSVLLPEPQQAPAE
ncbi:MAG TPA: 16S rRNA (guanine(966)-N(2))-methyltransferase RsmD [Thermomicrobiales bacterium]|nr:16S rRNA (guanine(966)-N(2))-methyltransferase RsmD [Thermomicrobiales bacterium]